MYAEYSYLFRLPSVTSDSLNLRTGSFPSSFFAAYARTLEALFMAFLYQVGCARVVDLLSVMISVFVMRWRMGRCCISSKFAIRHSNSRDQTSRHQVSDRRARRSTLFHDARETPSPRSSQHVWWEKLASYSHRSYARGSPAGVIGMASSFICPLVESI